MHGLDSAIEEPGCPICLQSYEPIDRAVISSCLHAFCIGCLQAWCRKSETRLCPLCKRRIVGYLYDIKSDHEYKEHVFDDEPPQQHQQLERWPVPLAQPPQAGLFSRSQQPAHDQQQSSRFAHPPQSIQPRQQQHVAHDGQGDTQRPRMQLRSEAGYTWGDPSDWRRSVSQPGSSRPHGNSRAAERHVSTQQQRHNSSSRRPGSDAAATAAGSSGEGGVAPRPYYWRVQQRMLASVTRLHSSSSNISGNTSAAQERRRAVYRNNLWALPHNTATAAATNSSSSSMRVSEAALELWMERELQALLLEDDVTIICAYVKGLVNSFGINVPTAQQQQHQQENRSNLESMRQAATQAAAAMGLSGSSSSGGEHLSTPCGSSSSSTATISSAVAALEGFLFEAAGHFWHELCCYASSGLTVTAWDRVARYVPAAQLQQQLPKQQQHGAGDDCGDGCPDVAAGQPADPQQQQQAGVQPPMFGQQLSVVRDAAAVHEFLVRRQQQQAQQPQPPIPRPPVSAAPITAEPTTAQAVAAAGRIKVPQQGQPTDRRRGSSSSGSSSSREQQQRDSSRGGRHRQRRHSRSRSRRRSSAERHDRSGVRLGPRHEQKHHSNSRQQHRNNSSSSGRHVGTRSTSRSRVSARQRSRQPHRSSRSGLREGHEQVHHTKQSRGQSDRYDAAVNTMGAAAAAVGVSSDAWGGRWGDEGAGVTDLHIAEGYSAAPGAQPYSVSQQQQQLVGWTQPAANDRWQMD